VKCFPCRLCLKTSLNPLIILGEQLKQSDDQDWEHLNDPDLYTHHTNPGYKLRNRGVEVDMRDNYEAYHYWVQCVKLREMFGQILRP
jgi:hypothetical protein